METGNRTKALAYHEAGHAVAAIAFGRRIKSCIIEKAGEHEFGETKCHDDGLRVTFHSELVIVWAGPIAEMKADPYAVVMAGDQSIAKNLLRGSFAEMIDALHAAAKEACELVEREWASIERIGDALCERRQLNGDEVHALRDNA